MGLEVFFAAGARKDLMRRIIQRNFAGIIALVQTCGLVSQVCGAELKVVTSGAFTAAYLELAPEYERATHNQLVTEFGASMGTTRTAIPMRLARGEEVDVVIMAAPALAELIGQGKVRADSRVDLVESGIGMAIRAGAVRPDISSVEALKRTVLAAKSIAISDSASGVYLASELFPKLGLSDQIANKIRKIAGEPVGEVVARGEAEIGFQQISELRPVKGVEIVGPLPPGAQRLTVFAAGVPATSKQAEPAREFIQWLASPAAWGTIRKSGLEPAGRR